MPATMQVPLERWDIERLYSPDLAAGKMYTRLGAWLTAIDQFDGAMFGMHHTEAVATDPQVLTICQQNLNYACAPAHVKAQPSCALLFQSLQTGTRGQNALATNCQACHSKDHIDTMLGAGAHSARGDIRGAGGRGRERSIGTARI